MSFYRLVNTETRECWDRAEAVYPVAPPLVWVAETYIADSPKHGEATSTPIADLIAVALPLVSAPLVPQGALELPPFGLEIDPESGDLVDHYTREVIKTADELAAESQA